ncbi:MAG: glycosyltransferase [Ruminococcus sp.]|nr:glycosyltransferase [Ruminococcus sp.]MBR3668321.1 glycosyltransferase [Ruminococcus sp.]
MEKPIKVLAIVYKLIPAGLENRLMDIIRNIDQSRIRIDVFTYQLDCGVYDDEVRKLGGIVYYNPPLSVKNMLWYVEYFRDFLKKHPEYRIVHAHQNAWCSVFCKGAYLAGVPIRIAHSRTAISGMKPSNIVKNVIKLPTKKYANYYFAVSEKAGRWLYGNKMFDSGRVQIWPNAIDAEKFYFNMNVRKRVRNDNKWENKYVVMHVGNFTPPKNHSFIFKVFSEIRRNDNNAVLVLIGDGDRAYINSFVTKYDFDKCVQLLGSRHDVNELLQAADVFLFPSLFEGLPGALVEAQAAGLPCVISNTIANEVHIIPDISILSINQDARIWAETVLNYKKYKRKNTKEYIIEKGYDIHSLTEKLCQFYELAYNKDAEK